jgi:geranylgeranyl diphosphate synthase, type II
MLYSTASFHKIIEKELANYSKTLAGNPDELYQPLSYMLSLGGKRMRPLLVLLANGLFSDDTHRAVNAALSVEVFHNFTLIHDDIMDNAPLRRNQETVFKKWNPNIAILAGDTMMVKAYQLLATYNGSILPGLLTLLNKTAIEVCEGQQIDMNLETRAASIEEYLKMIELKTAVLLAASLKMGAIVAGAPEADSKNLYEFGRHIGIAFQLQDDILDAYGNPEKFGKQVGGDILSNKKTFLYLKAIEKATAIDKEQLEKLFSNSSENPEDKINEVLEIFNRYQIKQEAKAEMEKYFLLAKNYFHSIHAPEDRKLHLLEFSESLMEREI